MKVSIAGVPVDGNPSPGAPAESKCHNPWIWPSACAEVFEAWFITAIDAASASLEKGIPTTNWDGGAKFRLGSLCACSKTPKDLHR